MHEDTARAPLPNVQVMGLHGTKNARIEISISREFSDDQLERLTSMVSATVKQLLRLKVVSG